MRRFVVLHHETPPAAQRASHFDLMIESGTGALWTWALPQWPVPGEWLDVEPLPDHRLAYLEYEGAISGDRGHVTRRDRGTCEVLHHDGQRTTVRVAGDQLRGTIQIETIYGEAMPNGCRLLWLPEGKVRS